MLKKTILIVLSIIFFVIGLWPVAMVFLIIAVATKEPTLEKTTEKQSAPKDIQVEIERLNKEIEELKAKEFVQSIIDKTSGK